MYVFFQTIYTNKSPFTVDSLAILGSCTKLDPLFEPGGGSPVVTYFKHSIIVVFPQPFWNKRGLICIIRSFCLRLTICFSETSSELKQSKAYTFILYSIEGMKYKKLTKTEEDQHLLYTYRIPVKNSHESISKIKDSNQTKIILFTVLKLDWVPVPE